MKVLVFGGTGRTGRLIAARLVEDGHELTAAGRRDPQIASVSFLEVDLSDPSAVRAAAEGMDAAISALASDKGNPVCSSVARALSESEGLRFVTIAGGGVDAPGDDKGMVDRFIGWLMRRLVPHMLADRQAELGIVESSRLRWTMLRPPVLNDEPAARNTRISFDRPASKGISRSDLARAA
ncbi:MAG: NAD(P)-binding oxidoreductase, partial [Gammaproteobacteria bacterium]